MKKNLAKKIVLGLLTGAVLMSSSVAWAGLSIGPNTDLSDNGSDGNTSADNGIAIGTNCYAKGDYNIVIGFNNSTSGSVQVATGKDNIVVGRGSEAGNYGNNGSFSGAIAIGSESKANGTNSIALGYGAVIDYDKSGSVALGSGSVASDDYVVSVGNENGDQKIFRKIVNVADGTIGQGSHDTVTGGQLFEIYGTGKEYILVYGSELIKGKNLTEAVVALDGAVKNITTPDLSSYAKTDDVADTYATKTELNNKANASDVYTKAQADATFLKISSNNNGINVLPTISIDNAGQMVFGETSSWIDGAGEGFFAGRINIEEDHTAENARAAMTSDGKVIAENFFIGNGKSSTNIREIFAEKATTLSGYGITDAYTKDEVDNALDLKADQKALEDEVDARIAADKDLQTQIDNIGGGAIAGINQRLDKTNAKINKVGAGAAALAALHPLEYDPDDKLTFSAGMGNYAGENAAALGAFYRPNEKFMVSLGGTMGNGENMVNLGLSIGLDKPNGYAKLSKRELIQEVNAVKAENQAMKDQLANADERIAKLEALVAQLVKK